MTRGVLVVLAVLALAGCGGGTAKPQAVAKPPRLSHALAHAWAAESSAVAQALAEGDGCTALAHAQTLQNEVDHSAGQIPHRLLARLKPVVDALPGRIACNPAPPPAPKSEPKPNPKAEPKPKHDKPPKHGHGHGHDDH
jgi:hypothetical protein